MKSFRVVAIGAMALGSVGWLWADTLPADPLIKFTTGGGGSVDITCVTNDCETHFSVGGDGFLNTNIFNETGSNITEMHFVLPTTNFDQSFSAFTDTFEFASISRSETLDQLTVSFSGVGNVTGQNSAFLAADPTAPSGLPGFVPDGTIKLFVFFGDPSTDSIFNGFGNGQEGTFSLSAPAPEPSTLWLSLTGVLGLVLTRRKLQKS
jgi:hypothetical protein